MLVVSNFSKLLHMQEVLNYLDHGVKNKLMKGGIQNLRTFKNGKFLHRLLFSAFVRFLSYPPKRVHAFVFLLSHAIERKPKACNFLAF